VEKQIGVREVERVPNQKCNLFFINQLEIEIYSAEKFNSFLLFVCNNWPKTFLDLTKTRSD
jgi:hypothetical protein